MSGFSFPRRPRVPSIIPDGLSEPIREAIKPKPVVPTNPETRLDQVLAGTNEFQPGDHITANFTYREMVYSEIAIRYGYDNHPPLERQQNFARLCVNVAEPIRDIWGWSMPVSSGFRCMPVNRRAGSKDTSQHVRAEAIDFTIPKLNVTAVFMGVASKNIPFDQLILEYGSWVHVSHVSDGSRENRGKLTVAYKYWNAPGDDKPATGYRHFSKQDVVSGAFLAEMRRIPGIATQF